MEMVDVDADVDVKTEKCEDDLVGDGVEDSALLVCAEERTRSSRWMQGHPWEAERRVNEMFELGRNGRACWRRKYRVVRLLWLRRRSVEVSYV